MVNQERKVTRGSNKTTEQKLIAAKRDAFRPAADWIPGIKIIQRTEALGKHVYLQSGKGAIWAFGKLFLTTA